MTPEKQTTLPEPVKIELFGEIPVRVGYYKERPVMPVADITTALGYGRGNISRLLKRNEALFIPYKGVIVMETPGGKQELVCLTEEGVIALLIKLEYTRIKTKGFREKVLEFQRWSLDTLKKARRGELVQTTIVTQIEKKPITVLEEYLDMADSIVKRTGMQQETAHAYAIVMAGDKVGMDLQPYATYLTAQSKQQLMITDGCKPVDQADFDSHFSLKYIANILKLSEDKTRNILESKNILCYKNKMWHLTTYGEKYGKAFKVQIGYPYRSIQQVWIRYNPELIKLLRQEYHIETTKVE